MRGIISIPKQIWWSNPDAFSSEWKTGLLPAFAQRAKALEIFLRSQHKLCLEKQSIKSSTKPPSTGNCLTWVNPKDLSEKMQ